MSIESLGTSPITLRDRRRVETLREIEDVALALFAKQGYAATTSQDIAREVGMSQRTFFRYCQAKVDAVLDVPRALDVAVAEGLQALPVERRTREGARAVFADVLRALEADGGEGVDRLRRLWARMLRDSALHLAVATRGDLATAAIGVQWADEARSETGGDLEAALGARLAIDTTIVALGAAFEEWARHEPGSVTLVEVFAHACRAS